VTDHISAAVIIAILLKNLFFIYFGFVICKYNSKIERSIIFQRQVSHMLYSAVVFSQHEDDAYDKYGQEGDEGKKCHPVYVSCVLQYILSHGFLVLASF